MPAKFTETTKEVLVGFYRCIRETDGGVWLTAGDIEPYCPPNFSRAFILLLLEAVEENGLVLGQGRTGTERTFILTAKGIVEAERAAEQLGVWKDFDSLRTSVNEVVDLDDPEIATTKAEAEKALNELAAALKTGNDVGNLSDEEVASALVEVGALKQMLKGAKVRAGVIATQARQSLKWIAEQAAKATVGELSKKALKLILALLGYGS